MKNIFVLLFFVLSFNAWSNPRRNACPYAIDLTLRIGSGDVTVKMLRTVANYEGSYIASVGLTDQWSCDYLAKGTLPAGLLQFLVRGSAIQFTTARMILGRPGFSGLVVNTDSTQGFQIEILDSNKFGPKSGKESLKVGSNNEVVEIIDVKWSFYSDLRGVLRLDMPGTSSLLASKFANLKKEGTCFYKRKSLKPDFLEMALSGPAAVSLMNKLPVEPVTNPATGAIEKKATFVECAQKSNVTICQLFVDLNTLKVVEAKPYQDNAADLCRLNVQMPNALVEMNSDQSSMRFGGSLPNTLTNFGIPGCASFPGDNMGRSAECFFAIPSKI